LNVDLNEGDFENTEVFEVPPVMTLKELGAKTIPVLRDLCRQGC